MYTAGGRALLFFKIQFSCFGKPRHTNTMSGFSCMRDSIAGRLSASSSSNCGISRCMTSEPGDVRRRAFAAASAAPFWPPATTTRKPCLELQRAACERRSAPVWRDTFLAPNIRASHTSGCPSRIPTSAPSNATRALLSKPRSTSWSTFGVTTRLNVREATLSSMSRSMSSRCPARIGTSEQVSPPSTVLAMIGPSADTSAFRPFRSRLAT